MCGANPSSLLTDKAGEDPTDIMSIRTFSPPWKQERRGSFFKVPTCRQPTFCVTKLEMKVIKEQVESGSMSLFHFLPGFKTTGKSNRLKKRRDFQHRGTINLLIFVTLTEPIDHKVTEYQVETVRRLLLFIQRL